MKAGAPLGKFVQANHLQLHYMEWGDPEAQPMLLLHGLMGHARVWDEFATDFSKTYRIIALDQRGHGESQWPKDAAYQIDDYFLDLLMFIQALDLRDIILVGHSMGGRNGLFYTACAPERISRLILIDARPGWSQNSSLALRQMIDALPVDAFSIEEAIFEIRRLYPDLAAARSRHIAEYGYRRETDGGFVPKVDIRMAEQLTTGKGEIESLWELLQNIASPTLIVRGRNSQFLSRDEAGRMCKLMPDARWVEIPKSSHMPHLENPTEFNTAIKKFLTAS